MQARQDQPFSHRRFRRKRPLRSVWRLRLPQPAAPSPRSLRRQSSRHPAPCRPRSSCLQRRWKDPWAGAAFGSGVAVAAVSLSGSAALSVYLSVFLSVATASPPTAAALAAAAFACASAAAASAGCAGVSAPLTCVVSDALASDLPGAWVVSAGGATYL